MNFFSLGILASFLSSLTWAIGSSRYSKLAQNTNPLFINFTRAFIALPAFLLLVLIENKGNLSTFSQSFLDLPLQTYGWFFCSVLASYAFGDLLFFYSSKYIGITSALAIASSYPLLTVLFELTKGQVLNLYQWSGLFVTLIGVIAVILLGKSKSEPKKGSTSKKNEEKKHFIIGVALGFLTAIAWTVNTISVANGGAFISAALGNSLRMFFSLILIALFSGIQLKTLPRLVHRSDLKKYSWIFFMEAFGGSFFYVYGMSHAPLYLASTLSSLAPVIAVPIAVMMKLEKFSLKKSIAISFVVLGIFLLNQ